MLNLILLISLISTIITHNERKSFKELIDIYLSKLDINDAYLSYDQYISLLKTLKEDYPNYLELSSIGKTYEGNEMPLIIIKSPFISNEELSKKNSTETQNLTINYTNIYKINNNSNNSNETYLIDISLYNKSGIFFTGMHHGREPVSMMMNIYLILHLLSLPKVYLHLFLSSTNIYFVPIINIDAYKYNSEKYLSTFSLKDANIRKNRKPHKNITCSQKDIGVDLNRNYDFYFGEDNKGSSGSPCDEQYRGEYPFSEPETNNIKNFVDIHPDIKITFNYHTWGNLIITPFNYLKSNNSLKLLQNEFPIYYKMYEDFKNEANFPINFSFGNADKTIFYMSNGEATDWFLGKKKILSFSPELGNGNKNSDVFFPNKNITFDILDKNLNSALYAIQKSMFYFKIELLKAEYSPCIYNTRYSDIYFNNQRYENNNLRDIELKNCFVDEMILFAKVKMTNYGFGTYKPGIEFNYNQFVHGNNNNTNDNDNKRYFYFLALDLKVNLDNIKSICYWSNLLKNQSNDINNKYNKSNDAQREEFKIRCANSKGDELSDMKVFIDTEIKFLESIIINIQIILKRDSFNERKEIIKRLKKQRFLEYIHNNNITNDIKNKNINENETSDLIKLYTKKKRIIKSENLNGEIIEWKFNSPSIIIKFEDFNETKTNQLIIIKQKPFKFITYMICSVSIMIFVIYRIIKTMGLREIGIIPMNSVNERRELNGNPVNYFEDINQFRNQNNSINNQPNNHNNHNAYQIARDDSEYSNSDSS